MRPRWRSSVKEGFKNNKLNFVPEQELELDSSCSQHVSVAHLQEVSSGLGCCTNEILPDMTALNTGWSPKRWPPVQQGGEGHVCTVPVRIVHLSKSGLRWSCSPGGD